jgi:RNA-binding protein
MVGVAPARVVTGYTQRMSAELTSKARAHLRSLAHHLNPLVQVGPAGITKGICDAVGVILEEHELVKVKLAKGYTGKREEAAALLAEGTKGQLVQVIGRVVVLYCRRGREDPKKPRIKLPG